MDKVIELLTRMVALLGSINNCLVSLNSNLSGIEEDLQIINNKVSNLKNFTQTSD